MSDEDFDAICSIALHPSLIRQGMLYYHLLLLSILKQRGRQ